MLEAFTVIANYVASLAEFKDESKVGQRIDIWLRLPCRCSWVAHSSTAPTSYGRQQKWRQ